MTPTDHNGPVRMCVICRERFPKRELTRYVVACPPAGGLVEDPKHTMPGRGLYACDKASCRARLLKSRGWLKKCKGVAHD